MGLVWIGLDLRGLMDEVAGLGGFGALAGFEDGAGVPALWWGLVWEWELAVLVECLAGRCRVVWYPVGRYPVGACRVGRRLAALFLADRCLVDEFLVGQCLVGEFRVGRHRVGVFRDRERVEWLEDGSRVGDWWVGDSLGCRGNGMVGDRLAGELGRAGGSWVGDSASCRRIRDSRRSRVVAGDTRCWVDDSRRPRLRPRGRDCSRRHDPIPIPSRPIPRAGCWRSERRWRCLLRR